VPAVSESFWVIFSYHSVTDPRHIDADPDAPFHVETDPDPTVNIVADPACHSDADLDPAPVVNFQCLDIVGKTCVMTGIVDPSSSKSRIRIRIHAVAEPDPDPQHWVSQIKEAID
jgi:hypothetical protein